MFAYRKLARAAALATWFGAVALSVPAFAQRLAEPEAASAVERAEAEQVTADAAVRKPATPSGLWAKALSTSEAQLTWSDNAIDEWEFRIEARWAGQGWRELGGVPKNTTSIRVFELVPGKTYYFRLRARNAAGSSAYSNESAATAFLAKPEPCVSGPTSMCLQHGRYRVTASFAEEAAGLSQASPAGSIGISEETGLFWFFEPANIEAIVKVHDGCELNDRVWVFTTGLTNLRVLLLVVDTETGATATYLNERGKTFIPVQDTDAFASCGR